jgi:thioesterase domain-containing protein
MATWEANAAYRPQNYAGTATLFRAQTHDVVLSVGVAEWRKVVRGLHVEPVPGGHIDVVREPNVGVLAERLSLRLLDGASDSPPLTAARLR